MVFSIIESFFSTRLVSPWLNSSFMFLEILSFLVTKVLLVLTILESDWLKVLVLPAIYWEKEKLKTNKLTNNKI